jgi:hypothetical protein
LHSDGFHNFYSSPNIVRQIKLRRMRWQGMWYAWERTEKCTMFWWESQKERDHSVDGGVGGRMGSVWMFGRLAGGVDSVAEDRDQWWAVANTMMNLQVLVPQS